MMTPKKPAAVALGRRGGKSTAKNRTPEERIEVARKAVGARLAKTRKLVAEVTGGTKRLEKVAKASARQRRYPSE